MKELTRIYREKAAKAEAEAFAAGNEDPYRLRYHLMPPTGWLNDPNGLCQKDRVTHVFFQYAPEDAVGNGKKCWGHYTSRDLLRWEYQGVFLCPDETFDRDGVYSGCALADESGIHIFYTGNVKEEGDYDYIRTGRRASQVLVDSADGLTAGNKRVLLSNEDYPEFCTLHVRDPKVWRKDGICYMVLGTRIRAKEGTPDQGAVLLYRSEDLESWAYEKTLTTEEPFGYMWECPDCLEFGDQRFLSISPQGLVRGEYENQNVYQSGWFRLSGGAEDDLTGLEGTFTEWDKGFDFYAPQTYTDEHGRRIMIGWMGLPDIEGEYQNLTVSSGWQHALTVPREITCRDGVLYQQPVGELKQLRGEEVCLNDGESVVLEENVWELLVDGIESEKCHISIRNDLELRYENGLFTMEFLNHTGGGRTVRKAQTGCLGDVRILMDTSAVEVYVNGGSTVLTTRYYPGAGDCRITVDCEKSRNTLWRLELPKD